MSNMENISLSFEKPNHRAIESLVANTLPEAIESLGGICEPHGYSYEIALPPSSAKEYGLLNADRVTPYSEHANTQVTYMPLAHPLILDFSDRVLGSTPVDIVELKAFKEAPPQRVLEKLSSSITIRPSRIELFKVETLRRIWVHSVYLFGFEAVDLGQKLKIFLSDHEGQFLEKPESYLIQLNARLGDFQVFKHLRLPPDLAVSVGNKVSDQDFDQEFNTVVTNLQKEELSKAIIYYDRLELDLLTRTTQDQERGVASSILESYNNKLGRVRVERNIRLSNIRERFRAQFRIQAIGARILILPTYRCLLRPNERSEANLDVLYCPVLREFLTPSCQQCHWLSRDFILSGKKYVCQKCS